MRKSLKYVLVIPALAAFLIVLPASKPAEANGSFGLSLSFGVPLYYSYPSYWYPAYPHTSGYYRPYGYRGSYYDYRPRHFYPRHRHHYPRHYPRHRGYDRWGHGRW